MEYYQWLWKRLHGTLWWKCIGFGILGLGTAIIANHADVLFPWPLPWEISREAINALLTIISSSMLGVTTFSLGAMTTAFGAVSTGATPRATKLLREDPITHNVLSTFIGTFIFSIVATIVLQTGSYGAHGRAVLFVITIGVIFVIVLQLMRWINHLINLGRLNSTLSQVEASTAEAIETRLSRPYLGANPWREDSPQPDERHSVDATQIGYVRLIVLSKLSALCEAHNLIAHIAVDAGKLVFQGSPLVYLSQPVDADLYKAFQDCFLISRTRDFEQDPRFGLIVLAEIATGALSPSKGDAGTAIDVIIRQTHLLSLWAKGRDDAPVEFPNLYIRPLCDIALFEDAFMLLARDGAHMIEVQLRLHQSLQFLQSIGSPDFRAAAAEQADIAYQRSMAALPHALDKTRLEAIYTQATEPDKRPL